MQIHASLAITAELTLSGSATGLFHRYRNARHDPAIIAAKLFNACEQHDD